MRGRIDRPKNERRPVIDSRVGTGVVLRGSGPVISRGNIGGPVRRGGSGGMRFVVVVVLLVIAYFVVGSFRHDIVRSFPAAFPILKALGYEVATFIRTPAELAGVDAFRPPCGPRRALYVGFLKAPPARDVAAKVLAQQTEDDALDFNGREIYWSCATSVAESKFSGAVLERALKAPATFRNITTIRRLVGRG